MNAMIKKAKDEKPNEFEHSREYVPIKPITGPPQDLVLDAIAAIFAKAAELLSKTRGCAPALCAGPLAGGPNHQGTLAAS